jgi:mannose-6-phosphate isomerase-like protein (cupin superfamily)
MEAQNRIVRHEFSWGVIEWLASGEVGNSQELSLARLSLPPGKATDTHAHGNCEESVYVTSGRVECTSNGRSATLSAGKLVVVPRGAVHGLRNPGPGPAEVILAYSSNAREFRLA